MPELRFRNKIQCFIFAFSLFVIWVHSYNSELFLGHTADAVWVFQVEHVIGNIIAQIAVPGFFMISAYLFFRKFTWQKLWSKWNSRIKSILLPYILWNSLYYLGYLLASRTPYMTQVVGRGSVPFSLGITVEAILHYTYNPVFWYLYQLILLIILAPVIYVINKNKTIALLYLACLIHAIYRGVELPLLNLDALLYYSVAAFAAIRGSERAEAEWNLKRCFAGAALLLVSIVFLMLPSVLGGGLSVVLFRLFAPIGLWMMIDESWLLEVKPWMKDTFFLYAIHFALVRFINKAGALLLPRTPAIALILYISMPFVIVILSYKIGGLLRRYVPTLWRLLNGSR